MKTAKSLQKSKKTRKKLKSVTLWPYPNTHPYFHPKSKCALKDSKWLETHFKHVFEKCNKDKSGRPPDVKKC